MWSGGGPWEGSKYKVHFSVCFFPLCCAMTAKNYIFRTICLSFPSVITRVQTVIKISHQPSPTTLSLYMGSLAWKGNPVRVFNWLPGSRVAVGQWDCDVETEAAIGGQTGIIRGGWAGVKRPIEQPASDLALQDAHKSVESALLRLLSPCIQQDSQLGSDKRFRSDKFYSWVFAQKGRNRGETLRISLHIFLYVAGSWKQAELSLSGDFFSLFKGEYSVPVSSPTWSTLHPRNRSSHPGQMLSP